MHSLSLSPHYKKHVGARRAGEGVTTVSFVEFLVYSIWFLWFHSKEAVLEPDRRLHV